VYGTDSADLYDLLHASRGKDFQGEAEYVASIVHARRPAAATLLDVACGTGTHLRYFGKLFAGTAGLELSGAMIAHARTRLPGVELFEADMRDFDLGRRFDAVSCLFGSIGYAGDVAGMRAAVARFAAHLEPGGVAVVEPWWFPERFTPGHVAGDVVTVDGRTIARVSHASRVEGASLMTVHYVVADAENGVRHFTEEHRCALFTREEYESAFDDAGLTPEYLPGAPGGRGLFAGVRR
jgi:SAM-dependent methyltransferase